MKVCNTCQVEKPLDLFARQTKGKYGRRGSCKACVAEYSKQYGSRNMARIVEYNREWRSKNPEKVLQRRLKNKYGIGLDQYEDILEAQGGRCAICGDSESKLFVDHDHSCCEGHKSCGKCVRGLLCRLCNAGIGMFLDDTDRMEKAITYIKEKNK